MKPWHEKAAESAIEKLHRGDGNLAHCVGAAMHEHAPRCNGFLSGNINGVGYSGYSEWSVGTLLLKSEDWFWVGRAVERRLPTPDAEAGKLEGT